MSARNEVFDRAGMLLDEKTALTGPQARGTIRLALKDAGLDARDVTPQEMSVVFERLMPKRLEAQGVAADQAQSLCQEISTAVSMIQATGAAAAAASMFERLDQARRS